MDSKSSVCMTNNGKDTNNPSHIDRRVHFVKNGEKWKLHKIGWCERGMQLANIKTKNFGCDGLNTRMKYIRVRLKNWYITLVQEWLQDTV